LAKDQGARYIELSNLYDEFNIFYKKNVGEMVEYTEQHQYKVKRWFDLLQTGDVLYDFLYIRGSEHYTILKKGREIKRFPINIYELHSDPSLCIGIQFPAKCMIPPRTDILI